MAHKLAYYAINCIYFDEIYTTHKRSERSPPACTPRIHNNTHTSPHTHMYRLYAGKRLKALNQTALFIMNRNIGTPNNKLNMYVQERAKFFAVIGNEIHQEEIPISNEASISLSPGPIDFAA